MTTTTRTQNSPADQAEQKFMELLRGFSNAMLVSHGANELHARPMAIAEVGDDGSVWFLTAADTKKTFEVARDDELMAVMQSSAKYLSVVGRGEIVHDVDHIRRLWKDSYKVWFKDRDDPNIVLIRFLPRGAEYWDNSGFEGLKLALRYAKAYVTGTQIRDQADDTKSHAKVAL